MQGFGILLLIVLGIMVFWPIISRWLRRMAANKAEDFIRNATGMPPRPGSRKARKMNKDEYYEGSSYGSSRHRQRSAHTKYNSNEPLIPKEYAEDVEYVETKDYSESKWESSDNGNLRSYHESQVSDAEWVEIKNKPGKK